MTVGINRVFGTSTRTINIFLHQKRTRLNAGTLASRLHSKIVIKSVSCIYIYVIFTIVLQHHYFLPSNVALVLGLVSRPFFIINSFFFLFLFCLFGDSPRSIVVRGWGPFAEDAWTKLSVGGIAMRSPKPCGRCQVPTINPSTLEKRAEPTATLATFR